MPAPTYIPRCSFMRCNVLVHGPHEGDVRAFRGRLLPLCNRHLEVWDAGDAIAREAVLTAAEAAVGHVKKTMRRHKSLRVILDVVERGLDARQRKE